MSEARFSREQIMEILEELRSGSTKANLSRKYGVSRAAIQKWEEKYGSVDESTTVGGHTPRLTPEEAKRFADALANIIRGTKRKNSAIYNDLNADGFREWIKIANSKIYESKKSYIGAPTIQTIKTWASNGGFSYEDTWYLLGLAKYIPVLVPSAHQVVEELKLYLNERKYHPFPEYIRDKAGYFWAANFAARQLFAPKDEYIRIVTAQSTVINLLYDKSLGYLNRIINKSEIRKATLLFIRISNVYRQHEPFYVNFVENMKNTLEPADFKDFEIDWELYSDAQIRAMVIERIPSPVHVYPYILHYRLSGDPELVCKFHVTESPIFGLGNCFSLIRYDISEESATNPNITNLFVEMEKARDRTQNTWFTAWNTLSPSFMNSLLQAHLIEGHLLERE